MKNLFKKLIAATVAATMTVTALPLTAFADLPDEEELSPLDFYAGIVFQTDAWSFRDNISQSEAYYWVDDDEYSGCENWEVQDAKITGNGTYYVSINRKLLENETSWNTLKLQTNIPMNEYPNVTLQINGMWIDGRNIYSATRGIFATEDFAPNDYSDGFHGLTESVESAYVVAFYNTWYEPHCVIDNYEDFGANVVLQFTVYGLEQQSVDGNYSYIELSDGTLAITKYNGTKADLSIPSYISGKKVSAISDYAFAYNDTLNKVTIPNGVVTIGTGAFYGCDDLKSVTIPDGMTTIGEDAFGSCDSLTEINLPDSVTKIGRYAFEHCSSLTEITLPKNLTEISDYLFYFCESLKSIDIPDGVTTINEYAFHYCSALTSVTIPDSVTAINEHAFLYCSALTSTTIPDSVTFIGDYAFSHSGLTTVNIPDSVTKIGDWAFLGCLSLTAISVDENNEYYRSIDEVLFTKDEKTLIQFPPAKNVISYTIPDSVENIENDAFWGSCVVTTISVPDSVKQIGARAFAYSSTLTAINVDTNNKNFKDIDGVLFTKNEDTLAQFPSAKQLSSYKVPENVETIAVSAFGSCLLVSVELPDSVTTLSEAAFDSCPNLESVTLSNSLTTIARSAFIVCESLKSIVIPDSVTSIGQYAFALCTSLKSVTIPESVTEINDHSFYGCPDDLTIYGYEDSYAETYANDNGIKFVVISDSISGDVNGDGEVGELDSVELARYLANWNVTIDKDAADLDGDGEVGETDSVILARRLAGWNV